MAINCPTNPNQFYQTLSEKIGPAGAYSFFERNGYRQPQTAEEVNTAIEQFEVNKEQETLLNQHRSVDTIAKKLSEGHKDLFLPDKDSEFYKIKSDDTIKLDRVSAVMEYFKKKSGEDYKGKRDPFWGKKGTVIHSYLQNLINDHVAGVKTGYDDAFSRVVSDLRKHDEFKNEKDSFFRLTTLQYKRLSETTKELITAFDNIQKSIDKDASMKVFTEISVADIQNERAGTIDFLVLFSDGSAAVIDYKTFVSYKGKPPSIDKQKWWSVQMRSYMNMLKNNYGINKIRMSRVIPISVNYSKKDASGVLSRVEEGFRSLTTYVSRQDPKYLRPIPVDERGDSGAINKTLIGIEERIQDLETRHSKEKDKSTRIDLYNDIKKYREMYRDILVVNDLDVTQTAISDLIKRHKKRIVLPKHEPEALDFAELNDLYKEIDIYTDIISAAVDAIKAMDDSDHKGALLGKAINNDTNMRDLKNQVFNELLLRNGGDKILTTGQGITSIGKMFHGLENWQIPAFVKLNDIYTSATERSRMDTEQMYAKFSKLDTDFREWAKQNGYNQINKFDIIRDKKTGDMHDQYNHEFLDKFHSLTQRARRYRNDPDYKELTPDEKAWLTKYFEINVEAVKNARIELEKSLKKKLPPKEVKEKLDIFDKYTDPRNNKSTFYKGNSRSNYEYKDFIVPSKEAEIYKSEEYKFIEKHKPVKEYYDWIKNTINDYQDVFGPGVIGRNFLPIVHADLVESISTNGIISGSKIFKAYRQKLKIREHDEILGVRGNTGEKINQVPLLYTEPLMDEISKTEKQDIENEVEMEGVYEKGSRSFKAEVEKRVRDAELLKGEDARSVDLTRSMMMFIAMANDHIHISNIVPQVESLKILINSDRFLSKEQNKHDRSIFNEMVVATANKIGVPSDISEAFDLFVERLIYGQGYRKEVMPFIQKYSSNKIIKMMMGFFSAVAIGANVILVFSNWNTARWNMHMMSKENEYFGREEMKKSFSWFFNQDERFVNVYDYIQPTTRNYLAEQADRKAATFISRHFRTRNLFLGHIKGDDRIDSAISNAMALRYKVDSDGKIKNPNFDKLINKDAPTVAESIKRNKEGYTYIEGVNLEEHGKFRTKVRKVAQRTKGMTNEKQKGLLHSSMMTGMFMHLRNWMTGMATTRFGRLEYDYALGNIEEGRFSAAWGEIIGNGFMPAAKEATSMIQELLSMGLYTRKINVEVAKAKLKQFKNENRDVAEIQDITLERFINMRKSKLNGLMSELRVYLTFIALLQLTKLGDMDDEDTGNIFTYNAFRMTNRALLEISFWWSPNAAMDIVRSPLPLYGLLKRLFQIGRNSLIQTTHAVRGTSDPHSKVGPFYYFLRTTPGVNQILDIIGYFERYNAPKGLIEKMFEEHD